jgi:hypothetical protein
MKTDAPPRPSDDLAKLADRARQASDNVKAATKKSRAELQKEVQKVREEAEDRANALKSSAGESAASAEGWWLGVQQDWRRHVNQIRQNVDTTKADLDSKWAARRADNYMADAVDAVEFAEAAVEEAEYAVLNAALAEMEAEELEPGRP